MKRPALMDVLLNRAEPDTKPRKLIVYSIEFVVALAFLLIWVI